MATKLRRFLMSGLVTISLILSSNVIMGIKSTLSAKDTFVPKTNVNSLQLRNAIRLTIYESCITRQLKLPLDGLSGTDLNTLLMSCLANGLMAAKRQFGIEMDMEEE